MATTIGFLCAFVGGILATFISTQMSVVVLPGVIGLFFMGGAAGVFGDKLGGKRGAVVSSFLLGFQYGVEGLWFASTDAIIVAVIMRLVGMVFGL